MKNFNEKLQTIINAVLNLYVVFCTAITTLLIITMTAIMLNKGHIDFIIK